MSEQKTMTAVQQAPAGTSEAPAGEPSNAANIMAQADAWLQAARQAYQRCQRGADAQRELVRRRNGSGQ